MSTGSLCVGWSGPRLAEFFPFFPFLSFLIFPGSLLWAGYSGILSNVNGLVGCRSFSFFFENIFLSNSSSLMISLCVLWAQDLALPTLVRDAEGGTGLGKLALSLTINGTCHILGQYRIQHHDIPPPRPKEKKENILYIDIYGKCAGTVSHRIQHNIQVNLNSRGDLDTGSLRGAAAY